MSSNFIVSLEIFFLVLSCLYVLKISYLFAQIVHLKQGKMELNTVDKTLLATSLSYIITTIIMGF